VATKKRYEEVFNKLLGTNIRWSRLTKEELAELATIFSHPELLLDRLGVVKPEVRQKLLRERVVELAGETMRSWLETWQGPLAQLARRVLQMEEKEKQRE